MARVTVVDCLEHVDNRFQLVLIAAKRARQLLLGAEPLVERGQDKPTVLALREIAEGLIGPSILEEKEEETLADYFDETGARPEEREEDNELERELAAQIKARIAGEDAGDAAARHFTDFAESGAPNSDPDPDPGGGGDDEEHDHEPPAAPTPRESGDSG